MLSTTYSRYSFIVVFFALFTFSSCFNDDKRYEMILGDWYGSSWIIDESQREYDASRVHFRFTEENQYTAQLGNREETGTYKLVDRMLYTHAEGQSEMAVRLLYLDENLLKMGMNRGGQMETLTLERERGE
jgi:hypothetical protein